MSQGDWIARTGAALSRAVWVFGATSRVDLVWAWGDLMNGLQIFPNLVGILGLAGVVAKLLREEEARAGTPASGGASA